MTAEARFAAEVYLASLSPAQRAQLVELVNTDNPGGPVAAWIERSRHRPARSPRTALGSGVVPLPPAPPLRASDHPSEVDFRRLRRIELLLERIILGPEAEEPRAHIVGTPRGDGVFRYHHTKRGAS